MGKGGREDVLVEFSQRFGTIAVRRGHVTAEQLKEALAEQVDDDLACRSHRLLGTILYEKNRMTLNQIEQVLDELVMEKIGRTGARSGKKKR